MVADNSLRATCAQCAAALAHAHGALVQIVPLGPVPILHSCHFSEPSTSVAR